eukprot:4856004-Pleurochrysis_carterae.AAC.2
MFASHAHSPSLTWRTPKPRALACASALLSPPLSLSHLALLVALQRLGETLRGSVEHGLPRALDRRQLRAHHANCRSPDRILKHDATAARLGTGLWEEC